MELIYKNKKSIAQLEEVAKKYQGVPIDVDLENNKGALICGDNFKIMAMLLKDFEGKIDLIYIDPPYNTNSQFYYNKDRVATISSEKNSNIAYDDDMDVDTYLEFIRERVYLMHRLLSDAGTLYFHIDLKIGHYIKIILDEIFGAENYVNDITRVKSNPKNFSRNAYGNEKDVIYIYSKMPKKNIFNNVKIPLEKEAIEKLFKKVDENGERYTTVPCHAPGETVNGATGQEWHGVKPPKGRHWRSTPKELEQLEREGKIQWSKKGTPRIKKYAKDHKGKKMQDIWRFKDPQYPIYPTEKNADMLNMIVQQSSRENSIIMDCFCGSGSFLKAGVKNGRKVIGIDKSAIAFDVTVHREELEAIQKIDKSQEE